MHLSEEALVSIAKDVSVFLKDDFASKFRRMLTISSLEVCKPGMHFKTIYKRTINFEKYCLKT